MADPRLTVVRAGPPADEPEQPVFYYDLGYPGCYLLAERIMSELSVAPEWEPVWAPDVGAPAPEVDQAAVEQAARAGLQPLRWPSIWPPDTREAMLVAAYAKQIGRAVAFSLAAFRQAFAGGRDLGDQDTVLIAAAACEIHPSAVLKGIGLRSTQRALTAAGARAAAAGVGQLPAIAWGGHVFEGPDALERASAVVGT